MKKYHIFTMKHRNLLTLGLSLFLFATAMPAFSQVSNDNEDEVNKVDQRMARMDYREGEVLVKFKTNSAVKMKRQKNGKFLSSGVNSVDALFRQIGAEEVEDLMPRTGTKVSPRRVKSFAGTEVKDKNLGKLFRVKLNNENPQTVHEVIEQLEASDDVEYAEPNYKAYIMADADDYAAEPLYSQQWGLSAINLPQLWAAEKISQKRPVIAILDTGIDITHPDLVDNLWTNTAEAEGEDGYDNDNNGFKNDVHGWDFINQTGNIRDNNGHGTHCAGIAAAIGNNRIGVTGANPDALIMPITIMQSDGTGDLATIIKGIDYAVAMGADILSMSIGTYATSAAFKDALGKAYQNAILVAAAGNDGYCLNHAHPERGQKDPMPMFPAAYNFVLGVQASSNSGAMAGFSNYDDDGAFFSAWGENELYNYELQAPGHSIVSTWPNGNYKNLNGTSMACPLVAGALSRLIQCKEIDSKEELFGDLIHSTMPTGDLDIYAAYQISDENRQPTLSFVTYSIDDSEGDGDGLLDSGETISIYPTIRNSWGTANNIQLSIELGDMEDPDIVEILDANVPFGYSLSSYAKNKAVTPLRLKISENCADNRHIKLMMKATCDNSTTICENPFVIVVKNVTKFSGMITQDTTLEGDKNYYIDNDIFVSSGCTLTIEPGARLDFASNKRLKIAEGAHLKAVGTPEKRIVFSGIKNGSNPGFYISGPTLSLNIFWVNEDGSIVSCQQSERTPIKYTPNNWSTYLWDSEKYNDYVDFSRDITTCTTYEDQEHRYNFSVLSIHNDTIEYCEMENGRTDFSIYLKNCILTGHSSYKLFGSYNNIQQFIEGQSLEWYVFFSNITNFNQETRSLPAVARHIRDNNYFNILFPPTYILNSKTSNSADGSITTLYRPSYFGTSREDLIRPYVKEFGNADGVYTKLDLSNMRTEPVREAHGIVWKVVVNGKDAQDEFEDLAPLGVGRHKFEVYFNRPMNKAMAPQISFGVREPYTQNGVAEDGSWNEEGTIYTAYKTITGKTKSDGLNRIYVYGAEDNEFFEIPYEKTRFNINIQAAGSMATGFAAEAGLGRVNLTWNNENNDFEDAMGFNVYRYGDPYWKYKKDRWGNVTDSVFVADTIRINQNIVDIDATSYIDYDVVPGETYYYYYKVLSTDLQEYDISNVVAVTPLTASKGDANGDTEVDVLDVITTVNYAAGQQPKPFIFEAADMNEDLSIDILDVIGIIKQIMNPTNEAKASVAAVATYTIEDGTLYVESPVELAGVQVRLSLAEKCEIGVADDLKGFEHTSAWLSDNDYLFLAYNMSGKTLSAGKHALLHIGDAKIGDLRLSDGNGRKVEVTGSETTRVNRLATDVMSVPGIYDLQGRKISGKASDLQKLPKGIYIVNGEKVVR